MEIDGLRFPEGLLYDEHHQWTRADGDVVTMGVTDYAQSAAGDVVFIELPRPGLAVKRGQAFASIESGKWVGRLYAPVTGTVLDANELLAKDPRLVNREPYAEGWVARIAADDLSELGHLMRSEAAREFVRAEIESERLTDGTSGGPDGES